MQLNTRSDLRGLFSKKKNVPFVRPYEDTVAALMFHLRADQLTFILVFFCVKTNS
jgi:hypothetical protein